jgi:small subunit ribosomal protein S21
MRVDKFRNLGPARIASRPFLRSVLFGTASRAFPGRFALDLGGGVPEIQLREGDRLEWVLKAFKRQMQRSGILQELRRRRHYVKPSEARELKARAAQRARNKAKRRSSTL